MRSCGELLGNAIGNGRKMSYIVPILLGFLYGVADEFVEQRGFVSIASSSLLLKTMWYVAIFIGVFIVAENVVLRQKADIREKIEYISSGNLPNWESWGKCMMLTVVFWLFTYVMLFPGVVVGDTSVQIAQFLGDGPISDWHPFLDTFLFGGFVSIGGEKNAMLGVGIFIALQMLVAASAVSFAVCYIGNVCHSRRVALLAFVFMSVYPMSPLSFMNMNKDSVFAIAFVIFSVLFCELMLSHGEIISNPIFLSSFVVVSLLTAMTKKTGVYIVSAALIAVVFSKLRIRRKSVVAVFGICVYMVLQAIVPVFLFPLINVVPGPKQEMLAIPEQQIARVVRDSPDDFSPDERVIIDRVIAAGFNGISDKYNNYLVDPIKGTYIPDESAIPDFMKLWVKKGLEHPWQYVATEIGLQSGWLAFNGAMGNEPYIYQQSTDSEAANTMSEKIKWPGVSNLSVAYHSWYLMVARTPIVNIPMYICIWATVVPCWLLFVIWKRSRQIINNLVAISPLLLSMMFLALCPTSTAQRYMLPMLLAGPIYIAVTMRLLKQ